MVDSVLTDEDRAKIDVMTHYQLCEYWRHCPIGDFPGGGLGDYITDRLFKHFGGFTPEISKRIG